MEQKKIFNDISNLPPEAQQQIADFVAFLRARYKRPLKQKQTRRANLANEPFIGIWKDREDMKVSSAWLRNIRETQWGGTS